MPLFAGVLVVIRRRRRRSDGTVRPVSAPPLWGLLAEEIAEAGRHIGRRIADALRWPAKQTSPKSSTP